MFYESCRDVDKKRMEERPGHLFNRNSNNFIFTENIFNLYLWICPYISRHLLSLTPLQARCRRYSRGER
ncbi:hypothetical protein FTO72_17505 [Escherichia coli]|nr:hypothetical protein FTO72_17505 [Escherichia coli]